MGERVLENTSLFWSMHGVLCHPLHIALCYPFSHFPCSRVMQRSLTFNDRNINLRAGISVGYRIVATVLLFSTRRTECIGSVFHVRSSSCPVLQDCNRRK